MQQRLWRSYSLLIQCDPLSGITFPRNTGQRDKTTERKQQSYLMSNVVQIWTNLYRKALRYVIKIQERLWRSFSLLIQCDPLSGITFPRNTGQRDKTTERKQQSYLMSNVVQIWTNLYRKALRYVIKIQERLNGGHFPYLSSVTL